MVQEQPNQTASLIATNNDAVIYLQMGQLDESYSLISEAVATLQNMIREHQRPTPERSPVLRYNFRWIDFTAAYSNANDGFESSDQRSGLPFLFQRCLIVDMPRRREIRANTRLCPLGLFPNPSLQPCSGSSYSRYSKSRLWQVISPRS
jgi:hypothetical protein